LASFFRLSEGSNGAASPNGEPAGTTATPGDTALQALAAEVSALRRQVEALTERLTMAPPDPASEEPAPSEHAPG
jgi:hypothetical protein